MATFHCSEIKVPKEPQSDGTRQVGHCTGTLNLEERLQDPAAWQVAGRKKGRLRNPFKAKWSPLYICRVPCSSTIRFDQGRQEFSNLCASSRDKGSGSASCNTMAVSEGERLAATVEERASFSGGDAVPTIFCGSVCTSSSPDKKNEADTRLVLRMAMTGESLKDLSHNLKKTYGPSMDLNVLMKLMTAEQYEGKTLFYVNEDTLRAYKEARSSTPGADASKGSNGSEGGASNGNKEERRADGFLWRHLGWIRQQFRHRIHRSVIQGSFGIRKCHRRTHTRRQYQHGEMEMVIDQDSRLGGDSDQRGWRLIGSEFLSPQMRLPLRSRGHVQQRVENIFPLIKYCTTAGRALSFRADVHDSTKMTNSKEGQHASSKRQSNNSNVRKGDGVNADETPKNGWSMERIPLEAAFQLLMRSEDKYRLVVDDDDIGVVQSTYKDASNENMGSSAPARGTPMFAIRGLEVSLDTSKGPVNFVPLFFSRTELQKFYRTCRKIFKILWLMRRSESREEQRSMIETKAAALGGIAQDTTSTTSVKTQIEDSEEEDYFGDGEPNEVKEFMEELGESESQEDSAMLTSQPLPPIPTMLALGVVSAVTGIWKLSGDLFDILLMHSPLEPFLLGLPHSIPHKPLFLESCLQQFSSWNKETTRKAASSQPSKQQAEGSDKGLGQDVLDMLEQPSKSQGSLSDGLTLNSLTGLQMLMRGAWHLVQVLQHAPASMMYVSSRVASQDGSVLPDIHNLRRSNTNVSVSTTIHIDEDVTSTDDGKTPAASSDGKYTSLTSCNMGLVLNLAQAFGSPDGGDLTPLTTDPVAMGIWMIGNLGMSHRKSTGPPTLGFGNIQCLKDGVPTWSAANVPRGKS